LYYRVLATNKVPCENEQFLEVAGPHATLKAAAHLRGTPTSDIEEDPDTYAAVVGDRLRAVRRQKRLSLQAVAEASEQEFKASVLGAYERGERAISVPRLQRLAALYEVPVDQLLPDRAAIGEPVAARAGRERGGRRRVLIDLTRIKSVSGDLASALQRFVTTIQVERQDFNGQVLTIRADDLRVIGATFGVSVNDLIDQLIELGLIYER
jgi:transcriptional regulator with XRE-family HTH domain